MKMPAQGYETRILVPSDVKRGIRFDQETLGQRRWIEELRILLKPSPVRIHHVPSWMRKQLLKRFGSMDGGTSGWALVQGALNRYGLNDGFDHWGSTVYRNQQVLVSEPYLTLTDIEAAKRFAEMLNFSLEIDPNSWWFPTQTTRLVFIPKEVPGLEL